MSVAQTVKPSWDDSVFNVVRVDRMQGPAGGRLLGYSEFNVKRETFNSKVFAEKNFGN